MEFNVRELADAAGLKTYDTALPMQWYEDVHTLTGEWPQNLGFVWSYDGPTVWGAAFPLTDEAVELLRKYHEMDLDRAGSPTGGHPAIELDAVPVETFPCSTCTMINSREYALRPDIEKYGTLEHEFWLMEMERLEG